LPPPCLSAERSVRCALAIPRGSPPAPPRARARLTPSQRKVYFDLPSAEAIGQANSRAGIKKLVKKQAIRAKKAVVHSRASVRLRNEAKSKGRHTGTGKRRGTRNARLPYKVAWVRRTRVLRRLLAKYREKKKIDKHVYHSLYMQAKGNRFKTKRNLIETIHKLKADEKKEAAVTGQIEARKAKAKSSREGKKEAGSKAAE
jgi:large subunit ribosomal protein L19e